MFESNIKSISCKSQLYSIFSVITMRVLTHPDNPSIKSNYLVLALLFIAGACGASPNRVAKQTLLPDPPKPDYAQCQTLQNNDKFDCLPEGGPSQESCEARGCCWLQPLAEGKKNLSLVSATIDVPYCFYPPNYNTYQLLNTTETAFGLEAYLGRSYRSAYPNDVETVKVIVKYETENRLHVKFIDPLNSRYEALYPQVPVVDVAASNLNYVFDVTGFKVFRKADNTLIFDSNNLLDFIYANQFLQLSTKLPSRFIYGVGDHTTSLLLNTDQWTSYTLWNHDVPPMPNQNLYGSHPFYLSVEESGNSHGVFLLNTNAMDILVQPTPALTFRAVGGVLDFYFFLGPTPNDVISQYTEVVGRPYIPPYWGLGFHLCRWGYPTLDDVRTVLENNLNAGIAIDTQWNDLDYMINQNGFTYNKDTYGGLPAFVEELHGRGMHYIPLMDPGLSGAEPSGTYPPYDLGLEMDVFVKDYAGNVFVGQVWNPESTVWPDFTHPNASAYWTQIFKNFHDEIAFDGAWIDMNEPSNFLSGAKDGCPESELESPPFVPHVAGDVLNYKTLCMTAKHFAGVHYDLHNVYGISEADVTSAALAEIRGKRPMVISRSTFSGFGRYAGHWSGDVYSTWDALKESISHMLSFSLYGIPLMGADICGFIDNASEALCNRWHQLGAFYPFSRNHNGNGGVPQDPASMGELVVASTKKAFQVRYALLPYLYTLFYRAHVSGETVARPLFFEFSNELETLGIDTEFLWGGGLLIVPVLQEGATSVEAYLPQAIWYDYYGVNDYIESKGEYVTIPAPLDTIPVFVRGGHILPQQEAKQTTTESRTTKIQLVVAPDENNEAHGELFWDDGDSLNTIDEKRYTLIDFTSEKGILRSENVNWGEEYPPNLGSVTVLGVQIPVYEVTVNGVLVDFRLFPFMYLLIENLDVSLETPLEITWKAHEATNLSVDSSMIIEIS